MAWLWRPSRRESVDPLSIVEKQPMSMIGPARTRDSALRWAPFRPCVWQPRRYSVAACRHRCRPLRFGADHRAWRCRPCGVPLRAKKAHDCRVRPRRVRGASLNAFNRSRAVGRVRAMNSRFRPQAVASQRLLSDLDHLCATPSGALTRLC